MINAPKITLILERYTSTSDGGGGQVQAWRSLRYIKGVLTYGRAFENVSVDREVVRATHQFWCLYEKGLDIAEKDRFRRLGTQGGTRVYDIVYVDPILEINRWLKIDLMEIK